MVGIPTDGVMLSPVRIWVMAFDRNAYERERRRKKKEQGICVKSTTARG
jgi:hypothetical protein